MLRKPPIVSITQRNRIQGTQMHKSDSQKSTHLRSFGYSNQIPNLLPEIAL